MTGDWGSNFDLNYQCLCFFLLKFQTFIITKVFSFVYKCKLQQFTFNFHENGLSIEVSSKTFPEESTIYALRKLTKSLFNIYHIRKQLTFKSGFIDGGRHPWNTMFWTTNWTLRISNFWNQWVRVATSTVISVRNQIKLICLKTFYASLDFLTVHDIPHKHICENCKIQYTFRWLVVGPG